MIRRPIICLVGIASVGIATSTLAQTQVPNEFQAGEPARAAEVNENFDVLEQAINQLEGDTSAAAGQVVTAIPLASEARWLVTDFYERRGALPLDNTEAGALAPTEMFNAFVTDVTISNGHVIATYGNNADTAIAGGKLEFVANENAAGVFFTCNASAEVAPHFDAASCAFVDEPPEPLATIRRQFASGIALASEARWLTLDYYAHSGQWPVDNNQAAAAWEGSYSNLLITSTAIRFNEVTVTYGGEAASQIAGGTLTFVATDNDGSIAWDCVTTVEDRYSGFAGGSWPCVVDADPPPVAPTLMQRQVASGFPLAAGLQDLVEEYYLANGTWPTSNSDVGAPAADTIINNYVVSVSVIAAGAVRITYGGAVQTNLSGSWATLTPTDNGGSISWTCTASIENRFVPYECRN